MLYFSIIPAPQVTMEWWTHLWLNEGFASWIMYLSVDHTHPEFDVWTSFLNLNYCSALALDALSNSHAVEVGSEVWWRNLAHFPPFLSSSDLSRTTIRSRGDLWYHFVLQGILCHQDASWLDRNRGVCVHVLGQEEPAEESCECMCASMWTLSTIRGCGVWVEHLLESFRNDESVWSDNFSGYISAGSPCWQLKARSVSLRRQGVTYELP